MQNSPADNLIVLKDVPAQWSHPTFVKTESALGASSIAIYFSIMFGQEIPTVLPVYLTRGSIKTAEAKYSYYVGLLKINRPVNTFAYPPVGTNQVDPISLITGVVQKVEYISKELFDMSLSVYKTEAPVALIEYFRLLGGRWNI